MCEHDFGKERVDLGKRIIAFIGPEGSGKTKAAKLLSVESGKIYLMTGDILRELAANDSGYYGEKTREMFANHAYLDGKLMLEIMCNRFSKDDTRDGFILDGGFRTVEEIQDFQTILEKAGRDFPVTVIFLNIPSEVSFERLVTGENARKRDDDTLDGLKSRLEKFNYRLEERLNLIGSNPNWNLIEINATDPKEIVYKKVCDVLR